MKLLQYKYKCSSYENIKGGFIDIVDKLKIEYKEKNYKKYFRKYKQFASKYKR